MMKLIEVFFALFGVAFVFSITAALVIFLIVRQAVRRAFGVVKD
jgi:hypothetical protein